MATLSNLLVRLRLDGSSMSRGLDRMAQDAEKFTTRLAMAGAAGGAAFAAGLAQAMEMDAAEGKMKAQLGLTAKEAERVGKVAGDLYADGFGESMEEVSSAITSVVQNMDGMRNASSAALQQTSSRALTLAKVMDEDVGAVTEAVSQMMRTGLAKDSAEAFDTITRGAQLGGNKAQDLLDTFVEYGTQFRSMGLSGQTAMGLITQGLQAGARDADTIADAVKEFSIEAVAGGERVRGGFESLGLNADKMVATFAKGGPAAAQAFDTVLDRLRAIKDPAERNATAIELFGTKAEDLGQALFALDPSSAAKGLGNLAGASDRAGKAMGETAAAQFERFKRQALMGAQEAVVGLVTWFQRHETTTRVLAVAVGVLTAAWAAYNVVGAIAVVRTTAMTEGTILNTVVTKGAAAATRGWALAQALLNAAFLASPIGWIVLGIGLIVAAVVLAYQRFDWFRAGVQVVWQAIVTAALWAWETILKPIFTAIGLYVQIVVGYYKLLWAGVQLAWQGIVAVAQWAWSTILQPIFKLVVWYIQTFVIPYFKLLRFWAQLVWFAVSTAAQVAWKILQGIFAVFKWYIVTFIVPQLKVFLAVAKLVWSGISAAARWAWDNVLRPVFGWMKSGVEAVKTAFSRAVDGIGRVWHGLMAVAKKPVDFVINTVYAKGIKAVWDKVAGMVGLPKMPDPPKFATGGRIGGRGTGTSDSNLIRASKGEYIVNARQTRRYYPLIDAINRGRDFAVAKLSGMAGDPGGLGIPGFKGGGLLGGIKGFFGAAKDWFAKGLVTAAKAALNPLISGARSAIGGTKYGELIVGTVQGLVDGVLKKFAPLEDKIGGPGRRAVKGALSQVGTPYSWGGGGPYGPTRGIGRGAGTVGFDCSALMQYGWYQAVKKVMPRTTYTQWPWLDKVSTPREGDLGFPHMGHVFMYAGDGQIVEAPYTGATVRKTAARPAKWGRPPASFAKFDRGGVLPPGLTVAYNGTGRNETIRTDAQEREVQAAMRGRNVVQNFNVTVADKADADMLMAEAAWRERAASF